MRKKQFMTPIWPGLLDQRHISQIGPAWPVYILLIDWTTEENDSIGKVHGGKPIPAAKIADHLGLPKSTVQRHLCRLEEHEYIRRRPTPHGTIISVLKSKKFLLRRAKRRMSRPVESSRRHLPAGQTGPLLGRDGSDVSHSGSDVSSPYKEVDNTRTIQGREEDRTGRPPNLAPENDEEKKILDELQSIPGFEPDDRAQLLWSLRRVMTRHPDVDCLRIAEELRDWFECGKGSAIGKRTMDRFMNWVRRKSNNPEYMKPAPSPQPKREPLPPEPTPEVWQENLERAKQLVGSVGASLGGQQQGSQTGNRESQSAEPAQIRGEAEARDGEARPRRDTNG